MLGAGVSALALILATPAPAQLSSPTTDQPSAPSAGTGAGKEPVSGATDIDAQGEPARSTVTPADVATPAGGDDGEIVLTGIRQSLANAQTIKRNADTVVDAVTAEDIGALPDRSVNEALQRIPGIAISRFEAPVDSQHFSVEGSGVTIRGLSYVRSEFNGRDAFAVGGGREIGFNDVPTELVGSIEVFKNLTADLIEGGISGSVNINTRKPFDSKDQLIYLSAGVNWGDFEERSGPAFVGLFSQQWRTAGGSRFGLLVSGSYNQQFSRADSSFLVAPLPRFNDDKNGNGVQDAGEGRILNPGTRLQTTLFDTFPVPAGRDRVYVPTGAGSRTQTFDRERIGVSAAAQFEDASGKFLATAQYLRADARENWIEHTVETNTYYSDINQFFPAVGTDFTYDDDGVFTSGLVARRGAVFGNLPSGCGTNADGTLNTFCELTNFARDSQLTTFSNRFNTSKSLTQDFSLNVKWEPVERLRLNFDGQYVKSSYRQNDDIVDTATYSQNNIDLRNGVPEIERVTPGFPDREAYFADPRSIYLRDAFSGRADNDGDEWAFRADAEYDFGEDSFLKTVRVGGRYADRQQTVRENNYNNWGAVSDTWTGGGAVTLDRLPASAVETFSFDDFYRGGTPAPQSSPFLREELLRDHEALQALLRQVTVLGQGNYVPLEDRAGPLVDTYFRPGEVYRNREKTWAGYARLTFGTDLGGHALSGNIGVRFVRTRDSANGSITIPDRSQVTAGLPTAPTVAQACQIQADQIASNPGGSQTRSPICTIPAAQQDAVLAFSNGAQIPDVARQTYNKWLPSLNLRYDLTPNLLVRFAASRAISRPNFGDLRNFIGLSVAPTTAGSFGFEARSRNPYLRPVEADQFDLTAEWYFAKVGSITGAVFYKKLRDIIIDNYGYVRTVSNNGQSFDVGVTGPANAPGSAKIKGAEISYQQTYDFLPGFLRGFGTQATFTYIDPGKIPNGAPANFPEDGARPPLDVTGFYDNLPLAGLSKYNVNVSAFYDLNGLYARLAYSWRSKYLLINRDVLFPYLPVYSAATGQADASLFYAVNEKFRIGVQIQNLLDATTKTNFVVAADGTTSPRGYFKSDRQYQLSVRLTL